jgi:succinyl-CoA synthetase beta subunit
MGFRSPPFGVADNIEGAVSLAKGMGYPVALKVASPVILHKTEGKGVVLDIGDEASLREALRGMVAESYLIQKMEPPGREVILGGKRDREFGHVLLFGLGGIFVEILRDSAIRLVPVDREGAEEMINAIQGSAILKKFRGRPAGDVEALKEVIVRLSRLLADYPDIRNLDINPLIVYDEGRGCVAVDAKIEVDS